ncbi:MAG TPA: hypothetical protein VFC09_07090 [Candidatus Dormibacteraeota bacterium]|nr:hypothetical protein [Candidatus Dormibacteraeota bacterium]
MKRFLAVLGLPALLLLAACGGSSTSSITGQLSSGGLQGSMVVTTDSGAIAAVKANLNLGQLSSSGVTIVDGDQHNGNHVCGFNVSKNGHSYQVDYYTDSSQLASLLTQGCSSTEQQRFLSEAP